MAEKLAALLYVLVNARVIMGSRPVQRAQKSVSDKLEIGFQRNSLGDLSTSFAPFCAKRECGTESPERDEDKKKDFQRVWKRIGEVLLFSEIELRVVNPFRSRVKFVESTEPFAKTKTKEREE